MENTSSCLEIEVALLSIKQCRVEEEHTCNNGDGANVDVSFINISKSLLWTIHSALY